MDQKNSIDITPSPFILKMLGQIKFSPLQCICELIDNSLDAFDEEDITKKIFERQSTNLIPVSDKRITIKTPSIKSYINQINRYDLKDKFVLVEDNGKGMNRQQLQNSIKAGFSSNNPVNKLGLFGMGFNISTARLGDKTEIITSRKNDDVFYKVTIDFSDLQRRGNFLAPIEEIKKAADEKGCHGTKIMISNLNPIHIKALRRRKDRLRELGKTYGKILREKGIDLIYDGEKCRPFQHCHWNPTRTGKDGLNSVLRINHVIDEKNYCTTCWNWLHDSELECSICGKKDSLVKRERKVRGWIGVQRFFDEKNYGFDLIRNGRVIKHFDKELFYWTDENGFKKKEYPVDRPEHLGRFIGELEIDFVQVSHQKDAFETESDEWQDFVNVVRGDGPIHKKASQTFGTGKNTSYLARLFNTFRNAKQGRANLVPARSDGRAMIQDDIIRDLRQRFFNNEAEYIDDKKWWDLIIKGEKKIDDPEPDDTSEEGDQTGGNIFDNTNNNSNQTNSNQNNNSENDNFREFEIDENLSRSYSIELLRDLPIKVNALGALNGTHPKGFTVKVEGALLHFKYWPSSKIFEETFLRPEDLLINELAYAFLINSGRSLAEFPLTLAERSIKKEYFSELHPEIRDVDDEIENLTRDMREHLRVEIRKIRNFSLNDFSEEAIQQIKDRMSQSDLLSPTEMKEALEKSEFLSYADLNILVEIFNRYPETLFDGKFFRFPLSESNNEYQKQQENIIKDASNIFWDIVWWREKGTPNSHPTWKGRFRRVVGSLEVIRGWRNE